jgi:hypothetical protein
MKFKQQILVFTCNTNIAGRRLTFSVMKHVDGPTDGWTYTTAMRYIHFAELLAKKVEKLMQITLAI